MDLYERTIQVRDGKEAAALCIIVSTRGSRPGGVGAKMLVLASGTIHGTIGGGELERSVIQQALEVRSATDIPRCADTTLVQHHGMCCGGSVDIYIEPVMKKNKLYIFGWATRERPLAKLAHRTGFDVFVVDERKMGSRTSPTRRSTSCRSRTTIGAASLPSMNAATSPS
ncbi:MAG: hypothetical protein IPP83_03175 [Flavobacteriales bacterium]|nr:hypothetical protein [Flavobacteriales bacterium]